MPLPQLKRSEGVNGVCTVTASDIDAICRFLADALPLLCRRAAEVATQFIKRNE